MIPLLIASLNVSYAASYTTILDLSDLTESASKVVAGKVISMQAKQVNGKIITTVTLSVDKTYVGGQGSEYSFDVMGGTLNGLTMSVSGSPRFEIGKSALVFANHGQLVGFGQGAFDIKGKSAHRAMGVNIDSGPNAFNFDVKLPNESEARDCLQIKVSDRYTQDWSLRTIDTSNSDESDIKLFPITVLQGNRYQIIGCTEDKAGEIEIALMDQNGRMLTKDDSQGKEATLSYDATKTERLFIGVKTMDYDAEAVKAAFSLGVMYK